MEARHFRMEHDMKSLALATLFFFTTALAAPQIASAQARQSPLAVPVTGIGTGTGAGAVFNGTFQLQRFANDQGQLVATGLLTGVVTTAAGATTSVARTITIPAAVTQATCEILHLDLGPLSLDLLGLQINLSRIVLDITAQAGAGNLLGNLLCAVAGLLDNPSGLARLLNSILALL
jgi:hypothetical protein